MLSLIKNIFAKILFISVLVVPPIAYAEGVSFTNYKLLGSAPKYKVLTAVNFDLSPYLQDALNNGVGLKARIQFRHVIDRGWWFNKEITLRTISFQLKYHALSQHYLLTRNDTNEHWNFSNLSAALRKLGELRQYPLSDIQSIDDGNTHSILAVAEMAPETLRLPLRIQSIFSDKYGIFSEGITWPLP